MAAKRGRLSEKSGKEKKLLRCGVTEEHSQNKTDGYRNKRESTGKNVREINMENMWSSIKKRRNERFGQVLRRGG